MKKLPIGVVGCMIAMLLAAALRAQTPQTQQAATAPQAKAASPTPVFLRFTNNSEGQEPFSWWMFVYHAQAVANAFANAGMLTPTGLTEQYVFPPEPERQLRPGQTTDWAEITKYLRASADQPPGGLDAVQLIATRGTHVSGFVQGRIRGVFEFAVGPEKRVIKSIEVDQAGPRLWLSLAHDIREAEDIRTAFDFIRANEAALDKVGPLHGRPAVHMEVTTGLNLEAGVDDPAVIEAEIALLRRMGFNNVWEPAAPPEEAEAFNAQGSRRGLV